MSKQNWYLTILVAVAMLVVVALVFNITSITQGIVTIRKMIMDYRIAIPAVACAFIFAKYNPYWMVMGLCALVVSASLQAYFTSINMKMSNDLIFTRAMAFLVVVYIVDYAKVLISKK